MNLSFEFLEGQIAMALNEELWTLEAKVNALDNAHDYSFRSMGLRQLRNTIWYLLGHKTDNVAPLFNRFKTAKTMNEQSGLMDALNTLPSPQRHELSVLFEKQWEKDSLVINKWLTWHAVHNQTESLEKVRELSHGPHFKAANPNKVRALYGAFAQGCWRGFHRIDGSGYRFFAEKILEIDALNPSTAARLSQAFETWYRLEPKRKNLVKDVLTELVAHPKLSKNSFEILKRSLDFTK
jgi:aminopeptidase N